jgi:hypothetical protein
MYPHERSLVERLAEKPFALLGVNSDPSLDAARRAVQKNRLTWRSWFDGGGTSGPIATAWRVTRWPTIYLIDAAGVIRYQDLTGTALDRAVDRLLAEIEQ